MGVTGDLHLGCFCDDVEAFLCVQLVAAFRPWKQTQVPSQHEPIEDCARRVSHSLRAQGRSRKPESIFCSYAQDVGKSVRNLSAWMKLHRQETAANIVYGAAAPRIVAKRYSYSTLDASIHLTWALNSLLLHDGRNHPRSGVLTAGDRCTLHHP